MVEIISPGDETWAKLDFYAAHDVDEVLIVDIEARAVYWLALSESEYRAVERSGVIDVATDNLRAWIVWPAGGGDAE